MSFTGVPGQRLSRPGLFRPGALFDEIVAFTGTGAGKGSASSTLTSTDALTSTAGGVGGGSGIVATLTLVNETGATNTVAATTLTLAPANAAGNGLVLNIATRGTLGLTTVSSVADTGGNSWSSAAVQSGTAVRGEMWVSNTTAVAGTITVTVSGLSTIVLSCLEFHGQIAPGSFVDVSKTAAGTNATPATGSSASTATTQEAVVSFVAQTGADTYSAATAGYQLQTTRTSGTTGIDVTGQSAYRLLAVVGAQSFSETSSAAADWVALLLAIKGLVIQYVASTAGGLGGSTGTLSETARLTSTAAGAGGASSTLLEAASPSGTAAGTGSSSATLSETAQLTGTSGGAGGSTANLTDTHAFTATAAGLGSSAAGILAELALLADLTPQGIGSASATLLEAASLTSTAAGTGGSTANLSANYPHTGTGTGIGGATAIKAEILFVKETGATETTPATTLTIVPANVAGHGLILGVAMRGSALAVTVTGVADTGGNSWSHLVSQVGTTGTDNLAGELWVSNTTAIAGTVTVTLSGLANAVLSCVEVKGQVLGAFSDVTHTATGTTSAPASGNTAVTAQVQELAVGFIAQLGSDTYSSPTYGYVAQTARSSGTSGVNDLTGQSAYRLLAATGVQAYGATSSAASDWVAMVATFMAAISVAALTGSGAGVGSASSTLIETDALTGTAAGAGGGSATLTLQEPLAGTGSGVGGSSSTLSALDRLTSTAAGAGSASGVPTASSASQLTGSGAGAGSGSAVVLELARFSSTAAGAGGGSATLSLGFAVSSTAGAIGGSTASLSLRLALSSTSAGIGGASAMLDMVVVLDYHNLRRGMTVLVDRRGRIASVQTSTSKSADRGVEVHA